jgi:hypothetical protein
MRRIDMEIITADANSVVTNIVADSPALRTAYLGTARGYHINGVPGDDAFCCIYSQPCPKPQNTITLVFEMFRTSEYLCSLLW